VARGGGRDGADRAARRRRPPHDRLVLPRPGCTDPQVLPLLPDRSAGRGGGAAGGRGDHRLCLATPVCCDRDDHVSERARGPAGRVGTAQPGPGRTCRSNRMTLYTWPNLVSLLRVPLAVAFAASAQVPARVGIAAAAGLSDII